MKSSLTSPHLLEASLTIIFSNALTQVKILHHYPTVHRATCCKEINSPCSALTSRRDLILPPGPSAGSTEAASYLKAITLPNPDPGGTFHYAVSKLALFQGDAVHQSSTQDGCLAGCTGPWHCPTAPEFSKRAPRGFLMVK